MTPKHWAARIVGVGILAMALGTASCAVQLAHLEILVALQTGGPWQDLVGAIVETASFRVGMLLVGLGAAATLGASITWLLLTEAEDEDTLAWWDLERRAREAALARGWPADELHIARAALDLEAADQGMRPETMARFLDHVGTEPLAEDLARMAELDAYAKRSQIEVDRRVRQASRPDLARISFAGREYTALDLSGRFTTIRTRVDALRGTASDDLVARVTSTPAPVRRR